MSEKPLSAPPPTPPAPPVKRPASYQGSDEQMADLAERARLISQEAGTKVTSAMREMIGAAAGIAGFAVESARDLVQYMVRRGQMTQEEADRLIREAEATHMKKPKAERDRLAAIKAAADKAVSDKKAAMLAAEQARPVHRVTTPGRILAQGAGKSVKQMPAAKSTDATGATDKYGARIEKAAEKPAAKAAAPVKTATVKAAAPAKAAAPVKAAAKTVPAKAAAKAGPPKKAVKAPAKPAAKKAVKKKR